MNAVKVFALARFFKCLFVLSLAVSSFALAQEKPRIVSVSGALTEIFYSLDLQHLLVGVDTTSGWPPDAKELPQVGYQRALSAEGILSLSPSAVVGTSDAGPPDVLQQLIGAGVTVDILEQEYTLEGLYGRIRHIGEQYDRQSRAEALIVGIQADAATVTKAEDISESPKIAFLMGAQAGSAMIAGRDTAANAMIELVGASNTLAAFSGYKALNAEALIAAAPEVLLVVNHGEKISRQSIVDAVLALPGVNLTPAGESRNILVMDTLRFLGFGPRAGLALSEFSRQLHMTPNTQ